MRSISVVLLFAAGVLSAAAQEFPQAEISNGTVTAKFYLPDPERGYYRGTRFDWSGVISSLQTLGHEFFGVWFEKYDPKLHDAITGPVEEFRSDDGGTGYAEAPVGGTFVRIGVGAVRKPEEKTYQTFKTYDIVDGGKWSVKKGKNWIEFTHKLGDTNGYAYEYTKRVALVKGKPAMTLEHRLKNTGKKAIKTYQYDHNFFMFDKQPTGPEASATFAFDLKPKGPVRGADAGGPEGKAIRYKRDLRRGESVFAELEGFGPAASDYDVRLEHAKSGAGVHITSDQPMSKLVYWSITTTFCPEPYILINVEPGRDFRWKYNYEFYKLPR